MQYKYIAGIFLFVAIALPTSAKAISFDDAVLKSVVQVQIYDTQSNQEVWGTGMGIGANDILTNYHVAEKVITDPNRYRAYACVITALNSLPDCKILLSTTDNFLGRSVGTPKYDQKSDLALLYVYKIKIGGVWTDWLDAPLNEWGFNNINLSSYTKSAQDLSIGDAVHAIGYPDYGGGKTIQVDGAVTRYATDYRSGYPLVVSDYAISHGNSGGPVFDSSGKMVGVTVQCYEDANGKCISGLFIPLSTVNWWYTNATNSQTWTWEGQTSYLSGPISTGVISAALCSFPLRSHAHYDPNISTTSCTCDAGYEKREQGGDCFAVSNLTPTTSWNAQSCIDKYGSHTIFTGKWCDCAPGYKFNNSVVESTLSGAKTQCVADTSQQSQVATPPPVNTTPTCNVGSTYVLAQKKCITNDAFCTNALYARGAHSHWDGSVYGIESIPGCTCDTGFTWEPLHTSDGLTVPGACVAAEDKTISARPDVSAPVLTNGAVGTVSGTDARINTSATPQKGFWSRFLHALNPFSWF